MAASRAQRAGNASRGAPAARLGAWLVAAAATGTLHAGAGAAAPPAAAGGDRAPHDFVVCYSRDVDLDRIEAFDLAILDPEVDLPDSAIAASPTRMLAYLSLGEVGPGRPFRDQVRHLALADNLDWQSWIMDLSSAEWRDVVVQRLLPDIRARGFRGLLLDTMDAVDRLAAADPERAAAYRDGLVELVRSLRAAWPDAYLIANRGFAVIDRLAPHIDGVLVESVFRTFEPPAGPYQPVPAEIGARLLERLSALQATGLAAYVLDYADEPELAREAAGRIRAAGFVPYVSTAALDRVTPSTIAPAPRRALVLHATERPLDCKGFETLAQPLNWLGLAVDYANVNAPLPEGRLGRRYRAVVLAFDRPSILDPLALVDWLERRRAEGARLIVVEGTGIGEIAHQVSHEEARAATRRLFRLLGLDGGDIVLARQSEQSLSFLDPGMLNFEVEIPGPSAIFRALESVDPQNRVHLRVTRDGGGMPFDCLVTGPAGGVALAPYALFYRPDGQMLWFVDVFAFLRLALDTGLRPAPDVTTLDGSRVFLSHIDGDGFASRSSIPPHDYCAAVVRDSVLARYALPITVSIVEGEVGPTGLFPERSRELEEIARSIFALPLVEAASHTYAHPFYWETEHGAGDYEQRHLPIPGYTLDLERETRGSVDYAETLLPAHKRIEIFLWSGNCAPGAEALGHVDRLGIENMNGGDTIMGGRHPSYTAVAPLTVGWDGRLQILAPHQNENVYTDNWTRTKWGFVNVIDTFRATESPIRVKPIDIYYHFYSGESWRSLRALRNAYDWAITQEIAPRHASHYARMVRDFRDTRTDRLLDGGWRIRNAGLCRTVRFDRTDLGVDLARSRGVIGFRHHQGSLYVHLDGSGRADVYLTAAPPSRPHVASASHRPVDLELTARGVSLRLGGPGPVACRLAGWAPHTSLEVSIDGRRSRRRADARGEIGISLDAGRVVRLRVAATPEGPGV